jgi:hypothetical protein
VLDRNSETGAAKGTPNRSRGSCAPFPFVLPLAANRQAINLSVWTGSLTDICFCWPWFSTG